MVMFGFLNTTILEELQRFFLLIQSWHISHITPSLERQLCQAVLGFDKGL